MRRQAQQAFRRFGVGLFASCLVLFFHPSIAHAVPTLPVLPASFNQVYRDAFGNWGDCRMGTDGCPDTVDTAGCLITAFAMVLDYYGVQLAVPAVSSCTGKPRIGMDPGILNDWLKSHRGYGPCVGDAFGSCCLEWVNLPQHISLTTHENNSELGLDLVSQRIIDQALRAGRPVIAGVHWGNRCRGNSSQTEDCHWVVITGKLGITYAIIDPYNPVTTSSKGVTTTLAEGAHGRYIVDRFVVVSRAPAESQPLALRLSFEPNSGSFRERDRQRRLLHITGNDSPIYLYVRVTDPVGRIQYVSHAASSAALSSTVVTSAEKRSLYPAPRRFSDGTHEWHRTVLTDVIPGTYTWEAWAEDPSRPGEPLAYTVASYAVVPGSSVGSGFLPHEILAIGLVVGLLLGVTTVIYLVVMSRGSG